VTSRRQILRLAAPAGALAALSGRDSPAQGQEGPLPEPIQALRPFTGGAVPITVAEHRGRVVRAQELMIRHGLDALVVGPGSGLMYFTGVEWALSERFFGMVLGCRGDPIWVTPAFEGARAAERIRMGTDIRSWDEEASPFGLVSQALRDRGAGTVGIEETMPFAFSHAIAGAAPAVRIVDATPVTAGCRMVKDGHELDLMKRACAITRRAHRAVFASLTEGCTVEQARGWCAAAHRRLGVRGGALVLFGPDAAFPHGTSTPRPLQVGDVVLIDGGGRLHGYASDITRTAVFGAPPTDRQRRIWELVRRAQTAAYEAVRPGVECQSIDAAARKVIEEGGFGPGDAFFTHRLGHGIGLDGHEWPYMVKGNTRRLEPGMTFTNEPGLYIPGEIGVRHEDTLVVTADGAENLGGPWTGPPDDPARL